METNERTHLFIQKKIKARKMRSTRRKTLSELNSNNTRGGTCPGEEAATRKTSALGVSGKHATAASRNHQGKPNNSQRRHSVYFSSGQTPRVDPRPLGDKAYINSCVRQLISFLSARGFDSALSPKTLAAPTAKEFAALALFLFRQADENFKFGSKTEDDVPTVFKQLRYPFQISKSALYAVGSPHTWPSLLTALTWLVQIFIYEEEAGRNEAKVKLITSHAASVMLLLLLFNCTTQPLSFSFCLARACLLTKGTSRVFFFLPRSPSCVAFYSSQRCFPGSKRRCQRVFLQVRELRVSGELLLVVVLRLRASLLICFLSFTLYACFSTQHFLAGNDAECEKLEREFASARSEKVSQRMTNTTQLEQVGSSFFFFIQHFMFNNITRCRKTPSWKHC